jgi:beta-1,4-mannosyltransferase
MRREAWAPARSAGMASNRPLRVAVVVLGDVGRSPRMLYHARALADWGAMVDLVGDAGSPLPPLVGTHPRITCHLMRSAPRRVTPNLPRLLFLGAALPRVGLHVWRWLWLQLAVLPRPDVLLLQTPPAIPTLVVGWLIARWRGARLVIDWHNFGYTMLGLAVGHTHPVVSLARRYERWAGHRADAHLCVSRAMQQALAQRWGIQATVLYDRPAAEFTPTPPAQRVELFQRLAAQLSLPPPGYQPEAPDRPALIISSTSWTADEDFDLLLDAVVRCEDLMTCADRRVPNLLVLITGEGPRRAHYDARLAQLRLRRIQLRTLWVPAADYPLLLGAADLGVSLHRSSSGLDLPMKIADMFGAGLPVCALDYGPCLRERVRHGDNGLLFTSAAQLAEQLCELFTGFPGNTPLLDQLRHAVVAERMERWADGWQRDALPVIAGASCRMTDRQRS